MIKKKIWNEEDYNLLKPVKNSFVGNSNTPHFGAQGKYFSFGVNALYKIDKNKSSIEKYGNKKAKMKTKTNGFNIHLKILKRN